MITCKDINALVTDFLDHSMSRWDRFRFRLHLIFCKNCRVHVHNMEQLIDAMGTIPEEEDVPEEMIKHFERFQTH